MWNNSTQSFVSKNKYRGREVKTADFSRVLSTFLHEGHHVLVDHIPVIIQKLHNLAAILLQLNGFRFYGCSLLFIYDGEKDTQEHYTRHVHDAVDAIQEEEEDEYAEHRHRPSRPSHSRNGSGRRSRSVDLGHHRHVKPSESRPLKASNVRRIRGEVNIRVVDFAHTTTGRDFIPFAPGEDDISDLGKGYDTRIDESTGLAMARFPPKHPTQPDLGFVYGLKSVCEALREIWEGEVGTSQTEMGEMVSGEVFDRAFPDGFEPGYLST